MPIYLLALNPAHYKQAARDFVKWMKLPTYPVKGHPSCENTLLLSLSFQEVATKSNKPDRLVEKAASPEIHHSSSTPLMLFSEVDGSLDE